MAERTLVIATGHALSLALGEAGAILAVHHEAMGRGHAEALMPALSAMLAPFGGANPGVRRIIVEIGPGSFTGLRIGHAAASALALAWGADLVGVRATLLVAADHIAEACDQQLAVALAAPRGQLWVERFATPALDSMGPPLALEPADYPKWAGQGACIAGIVPHAAAALGLQDRLFSLAVPLYVRSQDDASIA